MSDKDTIYRQVAIDALRDARHRFTVADEAGGFGTVKWSEDVIYFAAAERALSDLPSAQPDAEKYEYHYDHTDCIWYRPEARNRCPSTCAQYRDGWNDAMNYIFRDGKGYRPYRRGVQYEE